MTTRRPCRPAAALPPLTALITAALLTACSTSSSAPGTAGTPAAGTIGTTAASTSGTTAASTTGTTAAASPAGSDQSSSSDSARETAESRLAKIGPQLAMVLADYKDGKTQQAYTLAKSVSNNLYEGTTEGICSADDPSVERQIDPLLAATIPAAIQGHVPASQIAALTTRAQTLASGCLNAIHRSE